MKAGGIELNEALELLLKLSNKPHFFYVDEVKEIAKLIHTAYNSPTETTETESVKFADWIAKKGMKQVDWNKKWTGGNYSNGMTTQELYKEFISIGNH